ncbi:MAG: hypothetical protein HND52_14665 [Ignavibacteriae bacterium]|nr:hypothetical protein [Ignavibacteriota bacterium]NOG99197.1 hypothetical protein [Ignavibacteriota bacterium]
MNMNLEDRNNYLKGIVLLNIRLNEMSSKRYGMIKDIGSILGFSDHHIEEAFSRITETKFKYAEPPKFSHVLFAEAFLRDSIKIAMADDNLQLNELKRLWNIASLNSLSKQWLYWELENYFDQSEKLSTASYEIKNFVVQKN